MFPFIKMKRYYLRISGREPIDIASLGTFIVGREGDVPIPDKYMSRRHFTIRLPKYDTDGEKTLIIDGDGRIPSSGGTIVGGRILHASAPEENDKACSLRHNDEIIAGKTRITYLEFDAESDTDLGLDESKKTL
jgi:hypothetical protein